MKSEDELVHYPCYVWTDHQARTASERPLCITDPVAGPHVLRFGAVVEFDAEKVTCRACLAIMGHEVESLLG